jgi:hypothetical protein
VVRFLIEKLHNWQQLALGRVQLFHSFTTIPLKPDEPSPATELTYWPCPSRALLAHSRVELLTTSEPSA